METGRVSACRKTGWKEIWQRRGVAVQAKADLHTLIRLDGFDTGAGRISESEWEQMVLRARERLCLTTTQSVCEVGCGAGAFLYVLYKTGMRRVYGVDYAGPLLAAGAASMPGGLFVLAEASSIPFRSAVFDAVVSNSVFQYFPDHAYATSAFVEMVRVLRPGGRGLILDINDASKREMFEAARRAQMSPGEYERLYQNLPHLFYEREWWANLAAKLDIRVSTYEQEVVGYGNAPFRYNAFFEKPNDRWHPHRA